MEPHFFQLKIIAQVICFFSYCNKGLAGVLHGEAYEPGKEIKVLPGLIMLFFIIKILNRVKAVINKMRIDLALIASSSSSASLLSCLAFSYLPDANRNALRLSIKYKSNAAIKPTTVLKSNVCQKAGRTRMLNITGTLLLMPFALLA